MPLSERKCCGVVSLLAVALDCSDFLAEGTEEALPAVTVPSLNAPDISLAKRSGSFNISYAIPNLEAIFSYIALVNPGSWM